MAADFAGYPLKEAIKEYLEKKGWKITDIGVKADSDPNDTELMFHRIGLRVGAMITEKEFDRAMIFCGTGMGIHIAASKCPGVHAGVVESVPAAFRAITGNGVNVLALGAFYVTPELGKQCADAYLYNDFGSGWEWWPDFDRFHQIGDEITAPFQLYIDLSPAVVNLFTVADEIVVNGDDRNDENCDNTDDDPCCHSFFLLTLICC